MATVGIQATFSAADRERYRWLLEQITSAPVASDGSRIFDLRLALPPAKTVEESIDLARRPFVPGHATTPCFVRVSRNRSKVVTTGCEPVTVEGYEDVRFGVHLEPGHRFRWHVTEFSTGASVTNHCPSREAAIEKLCERLKRNGPARYFRKMLSDWRQHAYDQAKRASAS
jgi:hypothetical protein